MAILKILLGVFLAIVALTVFGKIRQKMGSGGAGSSASASANKAKDPGLSPAGFFLLTREEAKNTRVTVVSLPDCPSDEARRANALIADLQAAGIPTEMKPGLNFTFNNPEDIERVQKYASTITNPLVLVRGWAKCNPSSQDVIAQYRSGQ